MLVLWIVVIIVLISLKLVLLIHLFLHLRWVNFAQNFGLLLETIVKVVWGYAILDGGDVYTTWGEHLPAKPQIIDSHYTAWKLHFSNVFKSYSKEALYSVLYEIKDTNILLFFVMQFARHTRPEGHFKVWATIICSSSRCCHLFLGLKQGIPPLQSIRMLHRLRYPQSEAWLVEQKALPPQLYVHVASVLTEIRTHTLLINHQSSNPALPTARP